MDEYCYSDPSHQHHTHDDDDEPVVTPKLEPAPGFANGFAYPGAFLTNRQLEILKLAASGLSYKEMMERTGISRSAIRYHLSASYAKLEASGLVDAMNRLGWVCIP